MEEMDEVEPLTLLDDESSAWDEVVLSKVEELEALGADLMSVTVAVCVDD